jgi:signal peptidase I
MPAMHAAAPAAGGTPTVHRRPSGRLGALLARAALWLALAAAAVMSAATILPGVFGLTALTVVSGSMEPTLGVGSLVLDERITPLEAHPGDIVSFPDASRGGALVTHRVRSVQVRGARAYFVTKVDANNATESWSVATQGDIGRVAHHVPKAGYVRAFFAGTNVRFIILGCGLLLGFWLLADVWRRP